MSTSVSDYIVKSIFSPVQIIEFRCCNSFHGHVCEIKHWSMQIASTNICEGVGRSQELSEVQHTLTRCCLCVKYSHENSLLLNIPQSTVSGITNRKQLGESASWSWSGRPYILTVGWVNIRWGRRHGNSFCHQTYWNYWPQSLFFFQITHSHDNNIAQEKLWHLDNHNSANWPLLLLFWAVKWNYYIHTYTVLESKDTNFAIQVIYFFN